MANQPTLFDQDDQKPDSNVHPTSAESTIADETEQDIGEHLHDSYLNYAYAVVHERALPSLTDGLKPVQRKIIFAMNELGITPTGNQKKCARIIGDVIGKYHPHGDVPSYDALARLTETFTMRYAPVIGIGNFGSRDGDKAAAMRYTEARLSIYSPLLLTDLNQNTIDMVPNYDKSEIEPKELPARLPFILMNGATGVAVGMATNIPPHNLSEVSKAAIAVLKGKIKETDPLDTKIQKLMEFIKGPDFPVHAQVISDHKDIAKAYMNGKGSIYLRSRYQIENLARGQWRLVFTEIPYEVCAKNVIIKLNEIADPKPAKDKKAGKEKNDITPKQKDLKQRYFDLIESIADESGKDTPVRLVIEPKTSNVDPNALLAFLFTNTDLERSYPINMTMIGYDGRALRKNLYEILSEWTQFRFDHATRRTQHRYEHITHRIHILEGRLIAFLRIDEVIKVIRESDDPEAELMSAFGLTEIQAKDILEIRLRQLAKLEGFKLEKELNESKDTQAYLRGLLDDRGLMVAMIVDEMNTDIKKYGDDRKTLIEHAPKMEMVDGPVADDPVSIVLSKNGWLRKKAGHDLDLTALSYKDGDSLHTHLATSTATPVVAFDSAGRAITLPIADIGGFRGDGTPIASLITIQPGVKIAHCVSASAETMFMFANDQGYAFISKMDNLVSRQKAGRAFYKLQADEVLLPPAIIRPTDTHIAALSTDGKLAVIPLDQFKELPGGRGVTSLKVTAPAKVGTIFALNLQDTVIIEGDGKLGKKYSEKMKGENLQSYVTDRAKKGRALPYKFVIEKISVLEQSTNEE